MRKPEPLTAEEVKAAADRAEGKATPPDDADNKPTPKPKGRKPIYKVAFIEQAGQLYERGATDVEVAAFFGVSTKTIYRWSHKYPLFCLALKNGKAAADDRVERSLYHRATGYTFEAEKVFQYQGEIVRAKVIEHVPPSDTAMIFWLKNRRPEDWRDKHEIDHTGSIDHTNKSSEDMWLELLNRMKDLGVTPEMLALPVPNKMIDVSPAEGVANRPNGKNGTKH